MGLLRVGGGISGVEDYLEHGAKQHNEFTRDELDQRVVLSGDLDITREIIASMDNVGMKYLHITFSVKEQGLTLTTFQEIDAEIKKFMLAAYGEDHLDYYSELQRPKIKSQLNKDTGELVDRLDHIHIVIPRVNLLTGKIEDPTGFGGRNNEFMDALQEHINIKFNLASPKDNRRVEISKADIVARFKDDDAFKKGNYKALKSIIREGIVSQNVASYADFQKYLKTLGDVKVVNKGKDKEYLGIKIPGKKKFVYLYEETFLKRFFDLPQAEMQQRLGVYVESGKSRVFEKKSLADYEKLLNQWQTTKAKEVRYLNSGSKVYKKYKEASDEEKAVILADLEQRAIERYKAKEKRYEEAQRKQQARDARARAGADRSASRDAANRNDRDAGAGPVHQPFDRTIGRNPPPAARGRVRSLSELHVVSTGRRAESVLPRDVSGDLEQPRSEVIHPGVRRADARLNEATGRTSDSVVSQLLRDVQEVEKVRSAEQRPDIKTIKQNLEGSRLLSELAASHGLKRDDYILSEGADGGSRIRHKDEKLNHNVSDFLTKHMHMPWSEAQPFLHAAYERQLSHAPERKSKPARDNQLWKEFRIERQAAYENRYALRDQAKAAQQASEIERRREIKDQYVKDKAKLASSPNMDRAAKKEARSILAMQKVEAEIKLNETIKAERDALYKKKTVDEAYKEFLIMRAQAGDKLALIELRRQQEEREEEESVRKRGKFMSVLNEKSDDGEIKQESLKHSVNNYGDVTYSKNGRDILQDRGNQVDILDESKATIEIGLRLSAQKWGGKMKLYGSQSFIQEAIRISVEKNMRITFQDEAQEKYRQEYAEQFNRDKALQQKGQQFEKDKLAEQAAAEAAARAAAQAEARAAAQQQARAAAEQAATEQREAAAKVEAAPASEQSKWKRIAPTAEPRSFVLRSESEISRLQLEKKPEAEKKRKTSLPQLGGRRNRNDNEQDR